MALALRSAAPLKPELRLVQAISEFEASLSDDLKSQLRKYRGDAPPTPSDVLRFSAELNLKSKTKQRCFGPRFQRVLEFVQRFSAVANSVIGGSQQPIASAAWGVVRLAIEVASGYVRYFEELSKLFMEIGRSCPRFEEFAALFGKYEPVQIAIYDYYVVIVKLCQRIIGFSSRSGWSQFGASILRSFETEFGQITVELRHRSQQAENEINLAARSSEKAEFSEASRFRALSTKLGLQTSKSLQKVEALLLEERKRNFLNAFSTYDYHHGHYRRYRKQGSPSWFKTRPEYVNWKSTLHSRILLCTGRIGSGKTVLSASIVDDLALSQDTGSIAYFFCQFDHPKSQHARTIWGTIARQLLESTDAWLSDGKRSFATDLGLEEILHILSEDLPLVGSHYILIDGIDECSEQEVKLLLEGVTSLLQHSRLNLKFVLSFREDVKHIVVGRLDRSMVYYHLAIGDQKDEIATYISATLASRVESDELVLEDPSLILQIRDALLDGAEGMLLWVKLQIDALCCARRDSDIVRALKSLPKGLDETYERILTRLVETRAASGDTRLLFQILASARRPLTLDEIGECLAIVPGNKSVFDPIRSPGIDKAISTGGSLLFVDEETRTLHLSHSSIAQFLCAASNRKTCGQLCFDLTEAENTLGAICVTYLNLDLFSTALTKSRDPINRELSQVPQTIVNRSVLPELAKRTVLRLLKPQVNSSPPRITQVMEEYQAAASKSSSQFFFLNYALDFWLSHTRNFDLDHDPKTWPLFVELASPDFDFARRFPKSKSTANQEFLRLRSDDVDLLLFVQRTNHYALLNRIVAGASVSDISHLLGYGMETGRVLQILCSYYETSELALILFNSLYDMINNSVRHTGIEVVRDHERLRFTLEHLSLVISNSKLDQPFLATAAATRVDSQVLYQEINLSPQFRRVFPRFTTPLLKAMLWKDSPAFSMLVDHGHIYSHPSSLSTVEWSLWLVHECLVSDDTNYALTIIERVPEILNIGLSIEGAVFTPLDMCIQFEHGSLHDLLKLKGATVYEQVWDESRLQRFHYFGQEKEKYRERMMLTHGQLNNL